MRCKLHLVWFGRGQSSYKTVVSSVEMHVKHLTVSSVTYSLHFTSAVGRDLTTSVSQKRASVVSHTSSETNDHQGDIQSYSLPTVIHILITFTLTPTQMSFCQRSRAYTHIHAHTLTYRQKHTQTHTHYITFSSHIIHTRLPLSSLSSSLSRSSSDFLSHHL